MNPSALLHWEDFPVGTVMEMGGATVTRDEIVAFARQFDPQPFHLDEEAARHSLFGGLAASGWHTAALAMRMWCDGVLSRAASNGSPGVEKLRWLKPVRPGDTLRLRIRVVEARPMASKPHLGLMRSEWTVVNQAEEPVMTLDGWGILRRRGAG
jgi:acyl dehydratase